MALMYFSNLKSQTIQSGKASYYAKSWTGRKTANGERLHHDSLTCAHKTYPFGTLLRVTNIMNGMQVVVRVTDRGPYARGRVVDLSWGAARAIGMLTTGIAPVTVERIASPNIPFKPEDENPELPKFEFELADIAPLGIVPIWQQENRLDAQKVQKSMRQTANRLAQEIKTESTSSQEASPTPLHTQEAKDVYKEINENPNRSKAYLKREGRKP